MPRTDTPGSAPSLEDPPAQRADLGTRQAGGRGRGTDRLYEHTGRGSRRQLREDPRLWKEGACESPFDHAEVFVMARRRE